MYKHIFMMILMTAVVISIEGTTHAIPAPWELEAMKAKADLIAIGRMKTIAPISFKESFNRKVGMEIIGIFKTSDSSAVLQEKRNGVLIDLYYFDSKKSDDMQGVVATSVGGPGHPEPAEGEKALVFLKKLTGQEGYSVVCGNFGYVQLNTDTQEARQETVDRITQYRQWCKKIKAGTVRSLMDQLYQSVTDYIKKIP